MPPVSDIFNRSRSKRIKEEEEIERQKEALNRQLDQQKQHNKQTLAYQNLKQPNYNNLNKTKNYTDKQQNLVNYYKKKLLLAKKILMLCIIKDH